MSRWSWRRLVPDSIANRMVVTIVSALLLTQVVSALIYLTDRGHDRPAHSPRELLTRLVTEIQLVEATPPHERARVVRALNDPALGVELMPARPDFDPDHVVAPPLVHHLAEALGEPVREILAERTRTGVLAPATGPLDDPDMHRVRTLRVGVALSDATWLVFSVTHAPDGSFRLVRFGLWMGLIALIVAGTSLWTARWLTKPLATFTAAAEHMSIDGGAPPLPQTGPRELCAAAHAINRMQERLSRFVEDRTRMIAAIGHDLRTPLTRLRLRAEFIDDPESQRKILADLDEMETMIPAYPVDADTH